MNTSISLLALATTLAAGATSFLSPCVLPLVPGYVAYVTGRSVGPVASESAERRWGSLWLGTLFVLGFSTVFIAFGASATALGQFLLSIRYEANVVAGIAVVVFGLLMLGILRWGWLQRDLRFHPRLPAAGPISAYLLGLAFAFGWTPCIGPILGAILTTSAASATVAQGAMLLAVYSLGLGVPFLIVAVSTNGLTGRLRRLARLGRVLQTGAGVVMIVMGVAMATGQLTNFSYWLLGTFPVLAQIG